MGEAAAKKSNTGRSRRAFRLILVLTFLSALVYEFLTPIQSDDLSYLPIVREANSFADVFSQEVWHYFHHGGRNVAHLIMRIFMYLFDTDRRVFNFVAAAVFTAMTYLILKLVRRDAAEDAEHSETGEYLLTVLLVWLFAPEPGETVFWLTGTCNYLFTTTLILAFFALAGRFIREGAAPADRKETIRKAIALFVCALLAGWCNENTSGGVVLFCLLLLVTPRFSFLHGLEAAGRDGEQQRRLLPLRVSALVGALAGYIIQISSPGNWGRSEIKDETQTGIMLYVSRFLKTMSELETLFLPLLLAAVFLIILCRKQGKKWSDRQMAGALLYLFLFAATSFCLVLAPSPQPRVFFGPGIFLIIACVQLFAAVRWHGEILPALKNFTVCGLLLVFGFVYVREGANLARLYRETQNRHALLQEALVNGERDRDGDVIVRLPQLPQQFNSRYSIACKTDITDDADQFENMQLAEFYGEHVYVVGVPFDEFMEGTQEPAE